MDPMKVEIVKNGDYWDLVVNGRVKVAGESFAIVDGIKYALEHPSHPRVGSDQGELVECADSIRKWELDRARKSGATQE